MAVEETASGPDTPPLARIDAPDRVPTDAEVLDVLSTAALPIDRLRRFLHDGEAER